MIDNIHAEFNYLRQMKNLLSNDIQLNNLSRINNFSKETGLSSFFIYKWIEDEYRRSVDCKTPLQEKFSKINQQFIEHLDRRICKLALYLLLHNVKVDRSAFSRINEIQDLWIGRIQKDSPRKEELLYLSLHMQDILFACETIIKEIPETTKSFLQNELNPFVDRNLSAHLEFLSEEQSSKIASCFKDLTEAMNAGQSDVAKKELSTLHELVGHVKK
jgi:hypothetical protein